MKKLVFVLTVILSLTLSACSNEKLEINSNSNSTDNIISLEEGIWPENEYTDGLPAPPGMVNRALLNETKKYCAVFLVDLTDDEYKTYMELLKKNGFSLTEEVSEEIKNQDYISDGTVLSNDRKTLSISYIPGNLGIYISFCKVPNI